jgi:hypothetical protein
LLLPIGNILVRIVLNEKRYETEKESQQASQGINIGNQGGTVPEGMKGSNEKQNTTDGRNIPSQD